MGTVIRELPSGTIELELNKSGFMMLEFNCSCLDALPFCHAMCCRLRPGYGVPLDPDEHQKFHSYIVNPGPDQQVAVAFNDKKDCVYLTGENLCSVHHDKPRVCREFHCSPRGVGDGIRYRGLGWLLTPGRAGLTVQITSNGSKGQCCVD